MYILAALDYPVSNSLQNSMRIPGVPRKQLFFQEFSRALERTVLRAESDWGAGDHKLNSTRKNRLYITKHKKIIAYLLFNRLKNVVKIVLLLFQIQQL